MKPKIIKSEAEYEAALAHIETLMDAAPGSAEEEELELFALLVEQYEKENYPIDLPDPVDAILFRIEQQGLTRKDLIPYLGSSSKVSEVLNRKRPLSLNMIRNLHEGLGIPADILLQEPGSELPPVRYNCRDYPFAAMLRAGYFGEWSESLPAAKDRSEQLLGELFAVFGDRAPERVYCRGDEAEIDTNALAAWQARTLTLAQAQNNLPNYDARQLDEDFFRKLIRASFFPNGPQLVPRLLYDQGIHFVLLDHLPKTYLDGAAFLTPDGRPVVGMTLRHDRLDNFWFTLVHELAHVQLHLHDKDVAFFDDTDSDGKDGDLREREANEWARNFLIPADRWHDKEVALLATADEAEISNFAKQLEISPAIVAGRIRWESGDYTRFPHLVGRGEVRNLFHAPVVAMSVPAL
jgi:HTH-type transcriptional regulator / antitoxin HigA